MWWLFIIGIVVFVIYRISKEHNEHVESHITSKGGMLEKYKILIQFIEGSGTRIEKVSKETVILSSRTTKWYLDYVGCNLEIRMHAFLPILGNVKKKWIFNDGYPQEKMIEELENYCDWQLKKLARIAGGKPRLG